MKHTIITAALLLAGLSNALAASSVDLAVTGAVTPSACTPSLSAGGVVDHGKISHKDLDFYRPIALPEASVQLKVNCVASTLLAVKVTDNREGTSSDVSTSTFGLGIFNGTKVGWYTLAVDNALADGAPKPMIESVDAQTWFDAFDTTQVWQPNWMRAFNGATSGAGIPLAVQTLDADVVVKTYLVNRQTMPSGQEVPIDGSATLEVVYL